MKNRLIVDICWCALPAVWCCKTFTIIYAQNIVVQKIFVRDEGNVAASPASPLHPPLCSDTPRGSPRPTVILNILYYTSLFTITGSKHENQKKTDRIET